LPAATISRFCGRRVYLRLLCSSSRWLLVLMVMAHMLASFTFSFALILFLPRRLSFFTDYLPE
jgi:hypothetical protein